ncbi:MAG: AraC family transcriptional regulator [Lentisphaerae bacterium]|nr:MAG: AraC family transcriptional regulator [Lentisphaerota bacterium]
MIPISYRLESAGVTEHPPGFQTPWRRVGNAVVTQIRQGTAELWTERERLLLASGMGFLVPPGVKTKLHTTGDSSCVVEDLHFHCRLYEAHGLFTVLNRPLIFEGPVAGGIGQRSQRIVQLMKQPRTMRKSIEVSRLLAEIVSSILEAYPELEEAWQHPLRQRLLPVLRFIQDHLREPICREDLARVAGVSPVHLHNLCVAAFGTSPVAMVLRERMQHARQLLHWSDLPVAEVASRCGFRDPAYFNRMFKKMEGVAPGRYRRLVRQ